MRGSAAPRTGADGKPYETRFELRLPTTWSGRFLYQGGGGNDGAVAPAVGRNTGSFPDTGLQRGFAVVTTDAGHQGVTAEFGLDPVARVDHAYAAHERTYTIALAILSDVADGSTQLHVKAGRFGEAELLAGIDASVCSAVRATGVP